jgi:hypothetical protein
VSIGACSCAWVRVVRRGAAQRGAARWRRAARGGTVRCSKCLLVCGARGACSARFACQACPLRCGCSLGRGIGWLWPQLRPWPWSRPWPSPWVWPWPGRTALCRVASYFTIPTGRASPRSATPRRSRAARAAPCRAALSMPVPCDTIFPTPRPNAAPCRGRSWCQAAPHAAPAGAQPGTALTSARLQACGLIAVCSAKLLTGAEASGGREPLIPRIATP